jgi:deoxyribodipyrimidine photo-lyase
MKNLVWFRRDLRLKDNTALAHACTDAADGVVAVFFITPDQWVEHHDAALKVDFWLKNLASLSESLAEINIPLLIQRCNHFSDVPSAICKLAKKHDCGDMFLNREYEVNERKRDEAVVRSAGAVNIGVHRFHDRVIVPPSEIKTKDDRFYSVFTPYRKRWDKIAVDFGKVQAQPSKQKPVDIQPTRVPDHVDGFEFSDLPTDLWPSGEAEAERRLKKFAGKIDDYAEARDVPALEGTSQLSPYLAAGVISPRQCLARAIAADDGAIGGEGGATTWVSELAWRDFYTHVMVGFPRVSKDLPFKEKTKKLKWRSSKKDLEAWKTGQTGYPIVDAGMRQLNQTGWMHNRLRMVTAMFLTKNLLIDWREGEKYFMEKLIDGDLAANNGGWQWSASTGTDSVPYFRIFSPFSQSKRFDPEAEFIKQMCPELNDVPYKAIHDLKKLEKALNETEADYPRYLVDYKESRERALAAFKAL